MTQELLRTRQICGTKLQITRHTTLSEGQLDPHFLAACEDPIEAKILQFQSLYCLQGPSVTIQKKIQQYLKN